MSWLKSRFLRVGASSWKLKIDPKRPQEKINNHTDEERTRRSEKKRRQEPSKKIANELNNDRQ